MSFDIVSPIILPPLVLSVPIIHTPSGGLLGRFEGAVEGTVGIKGSVVILIEAPVDATIYTRAHTSVLLLFVTDLSA